MLVFSDELLKITRFSVLIILRINWFLLYLLFPFWWQFHWKCAEKVVAHSEVHDHGRHRSEWVCTWRKIKVPMWSTITPQDQASSWEERATHLAMPLDVLTMKSLKPWHKAIDFLCHTECWCNMGWSPHAKEDHAARVFALGSLLDRQCQMGLKVGHPQIHWFTILPLSYLADTPCSNKSISSAWSLAQMRFAPQVRFAGFQLAAHLKLAWNGNKLKLLVSLKWSAWAAVSLAAWRPFFQQERALICRTGKVGTSHGLPRASVVENPEGINLKPLFKSSNISNPCAQSSVSSSLRQSWLSFAQRAVLFSI